MDKVSQNRRVEEYMREHGSITTYEAFTELRITRLASRISDLRRSGVGIEGEMKYGEDSEGRLMKWKEYRLVV